jgi:hypothetical protein
VINFGDNKVNNINQSFHTNTKCSAINFGDNQYNHVNTRCLSNVFSNNERLINNNV